MEQFVRDNFTFLVCFSIVTTVIAVFASIVYRRGKGKSVFPVPEQDVLFSERWASGASHKSLLTKLGAASNCLSVTVSKNSLIIRPMFPLNLMFFPEVYDSEHVIPRSAIKNVEADGPEGSRSIHLEFESNGARKRFVLTLRRREDFLAAIKL
jgi:hypothetical protein